MTNEELKHLSNLSKRATNNHVIGHGSAEIFIYAVEFHALEQAIDELKQSAKEANDGS